jgi:transcriptional regulator with XRE-family HTH domain
MSEPTRVRPGDPARRARLRALRKALGLTQQKVADNSNGVLEREDVARIEGGWNQAKKHETRMALAHGLGVPVESLDAVLDGREEPDKAAARARGASAAPAA